MDRDPGEALGSNTGAVVRYGATAKRDALMFVLTAGCKYSRAGTGTRMNRQLHSSPPCRTDGVVLSSPSHTIDQPFSPLSIVIYERCHCSVIARRCKANPGPAIPRTKTSGAARHSTAGATRPPLLQQAPCLLACNAGRFSGSVGAAVESVTMSSTFLTVVLVLGSTCSALGRQGHSFVTG